MILNIILAIVTWISGIVIDLFPASDPAVITAINSQTTTFRSYLASANWLFPVSTLFTFLGYVFAIELTIWTVKLIRYVANIVTMGFVK